MFVVSFHSFVIYDEFVLFVALIWCALWNNYQFLNGLIGVSGFIDSHSVLMHNKSSFCVVVLKGKMNGGKTR